MKLKHREQNRPDLVRGAYPIVRLDSRYARYQEQFRKLWQAL